MIQTLTVEKVDIKPVNHTKNGKEYYGVGINIAGTWHNGMFWEETKIEAGTHELVLFEKDNPKDPSKPYKNWRFPKESDRMEQRIARLERGMKKIYETFPELNAESQQVITEPAVTQHKVTYLCIQCKKNEVDTTASICDDCSDLPF